VSKDITLPAQPRTDFGKGAARSLRRQGLIPAVMYGSGGETAHVVLPAHETGLALRVAGVVLRVKDDEKTLQVAPRDVQRDPVSAELLHLDLVVLSTAEVKERHALADAIELARANAEEAGLDAGQAAHLVEEAAQQGEDVAAVAQNVTKLLKAQAASMEAANDAADEAEELAAAGGEAEQEPAADDE
jgi:large subunit ribosomal protein L25